MLFEHQKGKVWLPVHCKPRCEKKAKEYCDHFKITAYLPLLKSVKKYESKTAIHTKPLLPSYLFIQADEEQKKQLYNSQKIVHITSINEFEEEGLIRDLQSLSDFLDAMNDNDSELIVSPEISEGTIVTITEGAFRGVEAVVNQREGKCKVFVNINMISFSVSAEVDISTLKLSI